MEKKTPKTPMKVIRAMCLYCSNGSAHEVKLCSVKECPLYLWRSGKNPYRTRIMTEEQRKAVAERLKKSRSKQLN